MPEACKGRGWQPCCYHAADGQHMVAHHLDVICCFCGTHKCVPLEDEPGHGANASRHLVPEEYKKAYVEAGRAS